LRSLLAIAVVVVVVAIKLGATDWLYLRFAFLNDLIKKLALRSYFVNYLDPSRRCGCYYFGVKHVDWRNNSILKVLSKDLGGQLRNES
jgi:hypothetical protein